MLYKYYPGHIENIAEKNLADHTRKTVNSTMTTIAVPIWHSAVS